MTVSNIDCDYDSDVSTTTDDETSIIIQVVFSATGTTARRAQVRFPLGVITAGSTVTDSIIQGNKTAESVEVNENVEVHAYNDTGDDDPNADAAGDKYTRSTAGTALAELVGNGTGTVQVDITATADAQIQGNITSPGFYSVGLVANSLWEDPEEVDFEALENTGSDPMTLIVTWTAPVTSMGGLGLNTLASGPLTGGRLAY